MTRVYWIVAIALVLLAWIISAALYPGMPAKIPMHWNIQGKIDAYGPKWAVFLMPGLMLVLLGLCSLLPTLSPRNFEIDSFRSTYLFIVVLVIGLFGYVHGVILYSAAHENRVDVARVLIGGLFLFFAMVGNVIGRVRRNFYVGVRVPWTLASERVWNDTHRLAAWLWVACGLVGFLLVIAGLPFAFAIALLIVAALVPIVYSFVYYKVLERRGTL
jgi:uncharacterized membrane protein